MGQARILLAAALLLGGCGHAARQTVAKPAATVDPEIRSLRVQLAQARAERDAALARLHALEHRKPAVVRVVVRQPAATPAHSTGSNASGQSPTRVFTNLSTAASP